MVPIESAYALAY